MNINSKFVKKITTMKDIYDNKVFICAPQHESKAYCFDRYIEQLNNFTFPNKQFFLSDNSQISLCDRYAEKLRYHNIEHENILYFKPEPIFSRIARSHQQCKEVFMKTDCDYMLHLETDVFPKDMGIIERLLSYNKPVVSALYETNVGFDRQVMAFPDEPIHRNIKAFRTSDFLNELEPVVLNGICQKVFQVGLGCVLIRRDIVELIDFRYDKNHNASADTFWANDLYANRVPLYLATNLYCEHDNRSWVNKLPEIELNF
jgi:hypothetical protein